MELRLKAPQSWNDITLNQYRQLITIPSKYDLEKPEDILNYKIDQTHILNPHITREDLMKMSMRNLKTYFESIIFLNTDPVLEECKTIEVDGKTYTFGDFKNMSLEQWIDCEKYSTLDNCHKLIAIFYIKPEEYSEIELDKVSDWLLNSPATKYFWSISFFLFWHKASELAIQQFSEMGQKFQKRLTQMQELQEKLDRKGQWIRKLFGLKSSKKSPTTT